jgi:hypothetical protein
MMYGRRPLTKLEAGLFAGFVGILLTVFARQALDYMELAERAAMEATLVNAVTAINLRLVEDTLNRRKDDSDWTRRNPFELARMAPANLATKSNDSTSASGYWRYDSTTAELVYTPRLHFRLQTSNGQASLRFRLIARPVGGYNLVPISPYRWD